MPQLISPIDNSVYYQCEYSSEQTIAQALQAARLAQRNWRQLSLAERGQYCQDFLQAMQAMNPQLTEELAWQIGRPVRFGGEMVPLVERVEHALAIAETSLAPIQPEPRAGFKRYLRRDPLGLVLVIAPWNYPFLTAVNVIVPALMAGNAVILKHATQTLLCGQRFAEAFAAANLPAGLFHNLVLSHEQSAKLIKTKSVDGVNFTGSVAAGATIERQAAGNFMQLGLELGGKDPAYVCADADLETTVANLLDGAFYNCGQCCCGIERIYVEAPLWADFIAAFQAQCQYQLGNPLDPETTMGPMVNATAADFIRGQINSAITVGARTLIQAPEADNPGSAYLYPQALIDVNHEMDVMRSESFGPVAGIMPVANDAEAVSLMNDSDYGLTASVWTADLDRAEKLSQQVETGTFFMNRCDYLDPALAWCGVKNSGRGASLSQIGYEMLTRPKSIHLRTGSP